MLSANRCLSVFKVRLYKDQLSVRITTLSFTVLFVPSNLALYIDYYPFVYTVCGITKCSIVSDISIAGNSAITFLYTTQIQTNNTCLIRYKLPFYATDGTTEAEMFCFDSIAKQIVGKPCEFLVKTMDVFGNIPSALSAIVGLKFMFVVTISINSCYAKQRIFNVSSVLQTYGKQETTSSSQNSILDEVSFKSEHPSFLLQTQESPATTMEKLSTGGRTTLVGTFTHPINYNCNYLNRVRYLTKKLLITIAGT
jgi:hypothetical protein